MRVVLYGGTGMIGRGVLRECLLDARVTSVLAIGRRALGVHHAKLEEIVLPDLADASALAPHLAGWDACFFCLGISSAGLGEAEYTRITVDLALAAARALLAANPRGKLCFVSGAGADSSESSGTMWRRVKGRAENALLALPFAEVTIFRPGIVQPLHGVASRTPAYRALYTVLAPLFPLVRALAPGQVTDTERIGRAMIHVALAGSPKRVLESRDIGAATAS